MSGTDVIANYLANISLQGNFYYTDEIIAQSNAKEIFDMIMNSYIESTSLIKEYYEFGDNKTEQAAKEYWGKIKR